MTIELADWQISIIAQHYMRNHGKHATAYIDERICNLTWAGNRAGAETWERIATRVEELSSQDRTGQQTSH